MLEHSNLSIEKYRDNTEVVHLTARQIMKDFAMFGMEIIFSGNTIFAYDELIVQVGNHLQHLLSNDHERLFALMYQIDINQASTDACLRRADQPHVALADLIIRREMMKVLTVKYFKELKNKT